MYVEKSDQEFSINALEEEDMKLVFEAIILLFNSIPHAKKEDEREAKKRIVRLKKAIEKEIGDTI